MGKFGSLAFLSLLLSMPGQPRQDQAVCGTHPEKWKEELFLHRQAARVQAALRLKSAAPAAPRPAANRDIGNIAVIEDGDGVVARRNEFNLDRKTVAFTPSAAAGARYRFAVSEDSYDGAAAAAGAPVAGLADDDFRPQSLPFPFPFFGVSYEAVFVNSDGNLTFNASDTATTDRSMGRLVSGPPRIAPLFMDLDPSMAPQSVRVLSEPDRFVVTWQRVPAYQEFGIGALQTFQARLYPDGRIEYAYNGISTESAIVGIAPGGLQGSSSLVSFLSGSSLEYSSTVAERFGGNIEIDIQTAAQKFYETHEDAYDYLAVFNNLNIPAGATAVAYESTVRNQRSGYGDNRIDIGKEFGSPSRLQAVLNLGNLAQYPADPKGIVLARQAARDTPLTIIAHETGHLFLAYASIRDASDSGARPMLGFQNAHWNFAFNSEASLLEGNRIRDDGPSAAPRFTTVATVEGYSPLDQYLMGFRAPEEVQPAHQMFLVTGVPSSFARRGPQAGVSFDGRRRDIQLDEMIQTEGRRTPDYTVAQRRFRFAFILIVAQGTQPSPDDLARLEAYRAGFEAFYQQASSNRAFADVSLRRSLRVSTFPAAGVIQGRNGSATVSLQTPPAAPLVISLQTQTGAATAPAAVTIPAGAMSAGFTITGLRAGVEEIAAIPNDSRYETAYSRVQVAPLTALRLAIVSGDQQMAGSGGPLPQPVVVRVTDINELPYPGVRLQASPSAGGSVASQTAVTDVAGQASFRWTPGSGEAPQLRIAIEGAPAAPGLTVQARSSRIVAAEAVSATSGQPGLAANLIVALYGTNLAAGASASAEVPWPDTLAGVRLRLNGTPLPLLYVSDTQINFYVPPDVAEGSAELVVSNALGDSAPLRVPVLPVLPGILFDAASGYGYILIAGATDNTATRPARHGEIVEIYCTGLGAAGSPDAEGLQHTVLMPEVFIGGVAAPVVFSALTSDYPGLYVVRVQIPDDAAAGPQTLSLKIGNADSNEVKIGIE